MVAVGSNASPTVLQRKLDATGFTAADVRRRLVTVNVGGLTVGHSAHVARRGYIPAAPVAAQGSELTTTAAWLDPSHLAALDSTEPNYHRMMLSPTRNPVRVASGPIEHPVYVYVSRHGVLGHSGTPPVALGPQSVILTWLARCLAEPALSGDPATVCSSLADQAWARRITARMRTEGLALDAGFTPAEGRITERQSGTHTL